MDRDPVEDIKKSCDILRNTLQVNSNKKFTIFGVVVFPNWYVKQQGNSEIKIINSRQFVNVYRSISSKISNDEQCLASYHLSKYIRSSTE